jgi:hypothetical protein
MCPYLGCDGDAVIGALDWAVIRDEHPEYPEHPRWGDIYHWGPGRVEAYAQIGHIDAYADDVAR